MTSTITAPPKTAPVPTVVERPGALAARHRRQALTSEVDPGRYLAVLDGADWVPIPVETGTMRIGRSPGADLHLDDITVSRRHALVLAGDDHVKIVDDRSLNGVVVNGRRVREAVLHDGDEIGLGRVVLRWVVRD